MMSNMEKLKYCIYGLVTGVMVSRLVRRVLSPQVADPLDSHLILYGELITKVESVVQECRAAIAGRVK